MDARASGRISLGYYQPAGKSFLCCRIQHPDLPGEFVSLRFFEHNEIPPAGYTLDEFRQFFGRIGQHVVHPDGSLAISQDMWTLTMTPGDDEVGLSFHVRNRTDHDWHDLVSITPCLSPKGWGEETRSARLPDGTAVASPTFVDEQTRDRTYISTEGGPFLVTDRAKHFFDEETVSRILSLPYETNVFRVIQHRAALPCTNRGMIVRYNRATGWVLGFGWDSCLCVNANNPLDCMHPTVRVGPLEAHTERTIRGNVYIMRGGLDDVFARYDEDLGPDRA